MLQDADFQSCQCIVEFGPGTGVFTQEIVRRMHPETSLFVIEQNPKFCENLKKLFSGHEQVHIVCDSAANIKTILAEHGFSRVNIIISGLPFTSLPRELTNSILDETSKVLNEKGIFITFQYTLLKKKVLERQFHIKKILFEMRNVPPAFVLVMKPR